jgi:hypothetical protein
MLTRILAAALLFGGVTHGAMAADSTSTSIPSTSTPATTSSAQTTQSIPQELRQKMTSAGYTEVEIVPSSFLVSARNKDGNKVLMRLSPNSMTMLTEVPVTDTSANNSSNSSNAGPTSTTGSTTPDTSQMSKTK